MKFNRKALLNAVNESLAAHVAAHVKHVDDWAEYKRQHRLDWFEKYRDAWFDAASNVQEKLTKNEPITENMLPSRGGYSLPAFYSEPRMFSDGRGKPDAEYKAPRELLALRDALSVISDDEIAPASLRNLGFTSSILRTAIQYLAKEGA